MTMVANLAPNTAFADEATCKRVLHDCNDALVAEQHANALDQQIIADEEKRYLTQTAELKSDQIWKPIALGAIGAALLEGLILTFKK